jgi:hypothetical protein
MTPQAPIKAILLAGVVAATIDIGAACLIYGRSIPFILHSIAGGLLADRSFAGGARTAILGLVLQEGMGTVIAAIYVWLCQVLGLPKHRWPLWGIVYGAGIFVVMNYVVVPLSAWKSFPSFSAWTLAGNIAAMFLFGLIVAFIARGRARET